MVVKRKERLRWILKSASSSATSEGYDTEETATLLGLTPGAVKTRSHRGRAALKSLLRPIMWGEGL